jgi:hypothetical protein
LRYKKNKKEEGVKKFFIVVILIIILSGNMFAEIGTYLFKDDFGRVWTMVINDYINTISIGRNGLFEFFYPNGYYGRSWLANNGDSILFYVDFTWLTIFPCDGTKPYNMYKIQ